MANERYHICGIGGIGMSGAGLLLLDMGFRVTGSDLRRSVLTEMLEERGAEIWYQPEPSRVLGAEVVVRSPQFPKKHPEIEAAESAGIRMLNRTEILGEICRMTQAEPVLCFGTTSRAKVARLLASDERVGWCAGAALSDKNAPVHAVLGKRMMLDVDERDFLMQPELFGAFRHADVLISDWAQEHFGYYSDSVSFQALIGVLRQYGGGEDAIWIVPGIQISETSISFDVWRGGKCEDQKYSFEVDMKDGVLQLPDELGRGALPFLGTMADASALAASICYARERGIEPPACDISCVGWFHEIEKRQYHEIRMHPVNVSQALRALRMRYEKEKIGVVMKPFVSTLFAYSYRVWCRVFEKADRICIIVPAYEGCDEKDCLCFCEQLRSICGDVECVSRDEAHAGLEDDECRLWIGAEDIL